MSPAIESQRAAGFTLIEMVVVLAIIGTLALLVGPSILQNVGDAKVTAARTQVETFTVALDAYRLDTGSYPTTQLGLAVLRTSPLDSAAAPGWRGPYLRKPVPIDPWGHPYSYRSPGAKDPYDLYTLGKDGRPGGDGEDADITASGEPVVP